MLDKHGVDVRLRTRATADELAGFDEVVLATGVSPRMPDIPGIDHPMVLSYAEAITGKPVGKTVAVVGAGGIGFDVSEFLVTGGRIRSPSMNLKEWKAEWGVADPQEARGALTTPIPAPPAREVYLLQRTKGPQGKRLGKTSGWVHRASLKAKGVQQLSGVNYERIDDDGLHISFGSDRTDPRVLEVDNVVICAGQESVRDLEDGLRRNGHRAARDRRRGRGRRARCQACDQAGHRTGGSPLGLKSGGAQPLRILQARPISLSINATQTERPGHDLPQVRKKHARPDAVSAFPFRAHPGVQYRADADLSHRAHAGLVQTGGSAGPASPGATNRQTQALSWPGHVPARHRHRSRHGRRGPARR